MLGDSALYCIRRYRPVLWKRIFDEAILHILHKRPQIIRIDLAQPLGLDVTSFRAAGSRGGVQGVHALSCSNMPPLGSTQIRTISNIGIRGHTANWQTRTVTLTKFFERSEFLIATSPQKKSVCVCACVRLILVLVGSLKRYCCVVCTWYQPAEIYTYVRYVPHQLLHP